MVPNERRVFSLLASRSVGEGGCDLPSLELVSASSERSTSHGGPTWGSQDIKQKWLAGLIFVRLLELLESVLPDHGWCLYLSQTSL